MPRRSRSPRSRSSSRAAPRSEPALEAGRPLSRSLLWRLGRRFYEREGHEAWAKGTVPHYITSNPWIADSYAQVVLGWLRDGVAAGTLDPREPVHVVELGAGSGRFGYLFLHRFFDLLGRSPFASQPVRYVLSDFTESTLLPLRAHPALQDLVAAGRLDFAPFDASLDREIRCSSGTVLAPGTLANPLAVIANYVFDSLPQDCFFLTEEGELRIGLVTLTSPRAEPILDDPEVLERVEIAWSQGPEVDGYYGEPDLDRLLTGYRGRLRDTALLFPVGALRAVQNLARIAGGRLLLLSGDKGYCHEEMLHGREEPGMAIHGSFSMMVNYHALGQLFLDQGGEYLHTTQLAPDLAVVACLLGGPAGGAIETRLAFEESVERRAPSDFFTLKIALETSYDSFTLPQVLAWVRLSGWDPNIFQRCLPALLAAAGSIAATDLEELRQMVQRVGESYFPIREPIDFPFQLGALLCQFDLFADALPYFERSVALYGRNPATVYNLGLCHFHLGELATALACAEEALAAAPDLVAAEDLKLEVEAALEDAQP